MVARGTQQYKHKSGRHRDLGYVAEQRRLLQANECVQWTGQAVDVTHQYVGSFGTGRNLLEKMLVVLHAYKQYKCQTTCTT